MKFRNSEPSEYVTNALCTGYDFAEIRPAEKRFLQRYMDKVFTNPEEDRQVYFEFLATSLLGKSYKHYCINNGTGNNAKSKFMEFNASMLGSYAHRLDVSNLCGKKDMASLNNLNRKRFVYTEEPDTKTMVFDGGFLKELTGCDKASWRRIYSKETDVELHFSLFICCNKKPPISIVDDPLRNRTIDFPFLSEFTNEDVDNVTRFKQDNFFASEKFRERFRLALFHYLLPYVKTFMDNKEQLTLTKNLKERRDEYLRESDELYQWFFDEFEIVPDCPDPKPYITMQGIYNKFKVSSFHDAFTKKDKRKFNKRHLTQELLSRKTIKKLYRERYTFTVNPTSPNCYRKDISNCLVGIREKPSECLMSDDEDD